jgi:glycosyltransferase involved in cell wall biosynthesis
MTIGLCMRYQKHDSTFAGLSVASYLKGRGISFSIRAAGWRARHVDPDWDERVAGGTTCFHKWALDRKAHSHRKMWRAYQRWIQQHSQILWTEPPQDKELFFALRHGRHTVLWTSWDRIRAEDDWALNMVDVLAVPTEEQRNLIRRRWKIKDVHVIPWDPLLPITRKRSVAKDGLVRIFMSIYGSQLDRVGLGSVLALSKVIRTNANVRATIACSKGLSAFTRREFRALKRLHGDNMIFLNDCPWHEQVMAIAHHDLTLWPTLTDGLGLVGITSLYMGTPVFSFNIPPVSEVLSAGVNSVLLSCKKEVDWAGVIHASPDHRKFEDALRTLCGDVNRLAELTAHTHKTLVKNRDAFMTGMAKVLPE